MKKILAILLAVSLIFALSANAFAVFDGETEYFLDFRAGQNDSTINTDLRGATYALTGGAWEFAGCSPTATGDFRNLPGLVYGMQFQYAGIGEYFAIKFNAPATGSFRAKMTHASGIYGCTEDIYIVPADVAFDNWFDDTYKIGQIDYYSATQVNSVDTWLNDVNLPTAGEYILARKIISSGLGGTKGGYLSYTGSGLKLSNTPLVFESATFAPAKSQIVVGDTMETEVKGFMQDLYPADLSTAVISYESADEDIASVDDSGIITAQAIGYVEISASVQIGAVTKTASFTLRSVSSEAPSGSDKFIDFRAGQNDSTINTNLRGATYALTGNAWEFAGCTDTSTSDFRNLPGLVYGMQFQFLNIGEYFGIKFNAPAAGTYRANMTHARGIYGCTANVYIVPADVAFENWCNDAHLIGQIDYYAASQINSVETKLNSFALPTAGEYILVHKIISKGAGGNKGGYLSYTGSGLMLDGTAEYPDAGFAVSDVPRATYTGDAYTPSISISYDGVPLVLDTHYTVAYSDNTLPGEGLATVNFIGVYTGSFTKSLYIDIAQDALKEESIVDAEGTPGEYKLVYTDGSLSYELLYDSRSSQYVGAFGKNIALDGIMAKITKIDEAPTPLVHGSLSGNEVIATIDAIIVQRIYNAGVLSSPMQLILGDVTGDSLVDLADAQAIVNNYVRGAALPILAD